MSANLRRPWSTKHRAEPAPSVTVFLAEERDGMWYPVIERHTNCLGMTHDGCTVASRMVARRGFATMTEAEDAMQSHVKAMDSRGRS